MEERVREVQSRVGDLMVVIVDNVASGTERSKMEEAGEAIRTDLESLLRFVTHPWTSFDNF